MVTLEDFLEGINHTPRFKGRDLGDGMRIVNWEEKNDITPSLEFGTEEREDGQYLYFEIVDFGHGYKEGDLIPLDDTSRRSDVIKARLTSYNIQDLQRRINDALNRFYGRN